MATKARGKRVLSMGGGSSHLEQPPEVLRALARKQAHIEQARHDINAMVEYVYEKPDGTAAEQGRMHREWQALADKYPWLVIVAPRLHWKTGQALARVLFKLGKDSNELIKIVCQSDRKATKRLTEIRSHMKDNDRLHDVFPHLNINRAVEWNKHLITLERTRKSPDPSIEALGVTSSASGDRATGIVADDVVDRRNAITLPKVRESIKQSWDDWINLLPPNSWLLYICTLWHNADLTHELINNPEYAVAWYEINMETYGSLRKYPDGRVIRSDEPLWGEADNGPWGADALRARRAKMDSRQFARSFSNKPMADSELRVKPEWIKPWGAPPGSSWPTVVALDLASTNSAEADYTGVAIGRINPDRPQILVEEAFRLKLTFPEKVELVRFLQASRGPDYFVVERAAGGIELAQYVVAKHGIPMRGIKPQGASKMVRLDAVTIYMENGLVRFNPSIIANHGRPGERGDLISELVNFPNYDTDDILDAFVHLLRFSTTVYEQFDVEDPDDWDFEDEDNEPYDGEWDEGDDNFLEDDDSEVLLI